MSVVKYCVMEWSMHTREWRYPFASSAVFDRITYSAEADAWDAVKKEMGKLYRKDEIFQVCAILVPDPLPMAETNASIILASNSGDVSTITRGDGVYSVIDKRTRLGGETLKRMGYIMFQDGNWYKRQYEKTQTDGTSTTTKVT